MDARSIFKPGAAAEHVSARDGYDRWAEIYDAEDNPLIAVETPPVRAALGDVAGLDVVELGCGTGRHTLPLAAAGARVTALDFSDQMVARAAEKPGWNRVHFMAADLTKPFPLPDAAFDRVGSFLVLEHIGDLAAFFAECGRVCRPDGLIVCSTLHPAMMLRGILAHFRDPHTGRDVCPAGHPHQISNYVVAIERANLRIEHMGEYAVEASLAERSPRAAKYLHWPMMLLFGLRRRGGEVAAS